ncbi:hypothetical protein DDB_G0294334, partial [Dictyostelium discoideum AX4]
MGIKYSIIFKFSSKQSNGVMVDETTFDRGSGDRSLLG